MATLNKLSPAAAHRDVSHASSGWTLPSKSSILLDGAFELGQIHSVRHVLGCSLALLNCPFGSNKVFFLHSIAPNFITLSLLSERAVFSPEMSYLTSPVESGSVSLLFKDNSLLTYKSPPSLLLSVFSSAGCLSLFSHPSADREKVPPCSR